ncbi:M56 family metallopeptidase [Dyadobacter crusticola]|uniref:M56 family metallopeptidase n=1 Tax=Dyadobacter crusticola TaxID=292407 RepID=UPI0005546C0A|nr:M56 family metallopeptidase [Dyadobacter crusticola]
MEMLLYLGKVNLYWILLFACYRLMLRQHTFFQLNRFYLLGSLAAAFALPFVIYPDTAPALPVIYEVNAAAVSVSAIQEKQPLITWVQAVWIVYAIGLIISGYLLFRHIRQLRRFLMAGEVIELEDCTVVMIDSNQIGSFSFLKWIVINRNDYESHFDDILCHEMVHVKQWHSADILFVEVMKVCFWFNPVLTLYKRDLQEVHEFLADSKASNRENYARFLVSYALNAPIASLTNHFFKPSQIKSRIQMIYKNRSPKWLLSTYLFAATMIGATALLVAGCEKEDNSQPEVAKTEEEVLPAKVFTVVETQPEFPGGKEEMFKFLGRKIKYPTAAVKANVQGRVFLSFIVTETGHILDVKVLKGLGFGCDEEAVRVIRSFPKWKPGEQNGQKVNVKYVLPINFQLEEEDSQAKLNIQTDEKAPLYVVDGKELKNADVAKRLAPDQIASVNVLKNSKATSIYGNKGKNGVIEIATKPNSAKTIESATIVAFVPPNKSAKEPTTTVQQLNPEPGSGIQFRTDPSVSLAKAPLYIVDGVKQENDVAVSKLDPKKIESISVLKEAGATTTYGEEGKNGVVLITTRNK